MNRTVVVTGFAVAALTLLAVQIVNRFGYSSTKGIVILGVVGALALVTAGMNSFAAIVVALAVYYGLDYFLNDKLTTAILLAGDRGDRGSGGAGKERLAAVGKRRLIWSGRRGAVSYERFNSSLRCPLR